MARTHGKLKLYAGHFDEYGHHQPASWIVEAAPYCMIRLKRIFEKAAKSYGNVVLSDSDENCRELLWFMERFPLEVSSQDRLYLKKRAAEFDRAAEDYELIIGGKLVARPFSLALPLRQYQAVAAELALRTRGLLLADEVGLGKTACIIGMLTDPDTRPALVVTLTHLPWQWQAEIKKFAPHLHTHILRKGTPYDLRPKQRRLLDPEFPDVIITSYSKLSGWADALAGVVKLVAFDEVQELRRQGSDKSTAAHHLAEKADWRIGASATPIFNYGGEFYNVVDVLRPGSLGTRAEFLREWCSGVTGYDRNGSEDKATIRDPRAFGLYLREKSLMLRRTRKDVGRELPPIMTMTQEVDCDESALEEARGEATVFARLLLAQNTSWKDRGQAARDFDGKLRQATGISKSPYVADFVRLLVESGEKVVLYAWHRAVYAILMERLKDLEPVLYTGSESPTQKEESRRSFVEGKAKILIMSLRSGAGLDGLQDHAHIVVFGELDWSPGVLHQCVGRIARDGQDEPTLVYYLLAREGSDHFMADVLGIKKQQLEQVNDPDAALVEGLQIDEQHIKRLAQAYLERHGGTPPEEVIEKDPEEPEPVEEKVEESA